MPVSTAEDVAGHLSQAALDAALDAIVCIDAAGRVLDLNPAAERMFGYAREHVLGQEIVELIIPPRYQERHRQGLRRAVAGEAGALLGRRMELQALRSDGSAFPIELAVTRLAGEPPLFAGFVRDVTERRIAELDRRERVARQGLIVALGQRALAGVDLVTLTGEALATVSQTLDVGVGGALEIDDAGQLRRVAAVQDGFPVDPGEMVGEPEEVVTRRVIAAGAPVILEGDELRSLLRDTGRAGADVGAVLAVPVRGGGKPSGVIAFTGQGREVFAPDDVVFVEAMATILGTAVARRRAEEHAEHLTVHDALTGLPNRALFHDRVEQALGRGEEGIAAVLVVDIDGFRALNDRYGHLSADEALVAVAARLRRIAGDDATVARLASDEFGVLAPGVRDEDDAVALAGRIQAAVAQPVLAGGQEVALTVSIGVAVTEPRMGSVPEAIGAADAARWRAHERGGGRHELYAPGMRHKLRRRVEIEQELRRALEQDELCLHFQPIVDLATGDLAAMEALLRWQHPVHGLLGPGTFLPAAEESGLIVTVGRNVLERACQELARWSAVLPEGGVPAMNVNVSARQFDDDSFIDSVRDAVQSTGIDPALLVLELTETLLVADHTDATDLDALRELGVRVVLDDFGTGFASLDYIRRLPFEAVKIDRSFVTGLPASDRDAALVEGMVRIGHSLDLRVVGEGVETTDQLDVLRALGCDEVQGFLFARPLDAGAALELLTSGDRWGALATSSGRG